MRSQFLTSILLALCVAHGALSLPLEVIPDAPASNENGRQNEEKINAAKNLANKNILKIDPSLDINQVKQIVETPKNGPGVPIKFNSPAVPKKLSRRSTVPSRPQSPLLGPFLQGLPHGGPKPPAPNGPVTITPPTSKPKITLGTPVFPAKPKKLSKRSTVPGCPQSPLLGPLLQGLPHRGPKKLSKRSTPPRPQSPLLNSFLNALPHRGPKKLSKRSTAPPNQL